MFKRLQNSPATPNLVLLLKKDNLIRPLSLHQFGRHSISIDCLLRTWYYFCFWLLLVILFEEKKVSGSQLLLLILLLYYEVWYYLFISYYHTTTNNNNYCTCDGHLGPLSVHQSTHHERCGVDKAIESVRYFLGTIIIVWSKLTRSWIDRLPRGVQYTYVCDSCTTRIIVP